MQKRSILFGFIAGLLVTAIVLFILFIIPKKEEGKGYDSAEGALLAYLTALKSLDYNEALSTFAIETAVEKMSLRESIELEEKYVYFYGTERFFDMYSTDDFSEKSMIEGRKRLINTYMIAPFYRVCMGLYGEESSPGVVHYDNIENFDAEYIHGRDTEKIISDMEIGEIYRLEELPYVLAVSEEEIAVLLDQRQKMLQADDIAVLAAEIRIDGEDYIILMQSVCYGKKWYNFMASENPLFKAKTDNGGLIRSDELILK
ncbi:MAG: hypothetical protein J6D00_07460 [Christensenellaceae bacterium]|nr:hypothetical protein [Christensenellaceae bacterium]